MKNCPNCGELIGDNVDECFKCHYNYSCRRVITSYEIKSRKEQKEREEEEEKRKIELLKREKEIQKREKEIQKKDQIKKNPVYEYEIETVNDLKSGETNKMIIKSVIDRYSSDGWRLHSIFVNELGKSSTSTSVSFLGMSVNATICQTVLVFERCIKEKEI